MSDTQEIISETIDQNNDQTNNEDKNLVEKIVQERLNDQLKEIKSKLDKAYNSRDEALKRVADFEKQQRDAELKRLEEEGKHKEAFEIKLAEEKAARELLERQNIELTRDIEVKNILANQDFRSENAREMAYKEIVGQLIRDDKGRWVHRSGIAVKDFVKSFTENDDNQFLFKPKPSSGGGSSSTRPSNVDSKPKSLFEMSQEEVLKLAAEGKLKR